MNANKDKLLLATERDVDVQSFPDNQGGLSNITGEGVL